MMLPLPRRTRALTGTAVFMSAALGMATPAAALNLTEAWERALAYDSTWLAAQQTLEGDQASLRRSKSSFLPQFSAFYRLEDGRREEARKNENSLADVDIDKRNYGLEARWKLLNVTDYFSFRGSKSRLSVTERQTRAAAQDLIHRLAQSYFAVLRADLAQHEAERQLDSAAKLCRQQSLLRDLGEALPAHYASAHANAVGALANEQFRASEQRRTREELQRMTGIDDISAQAFAVLGSADFAALNENRGADQWARQAAANNPEVQVAEEQVRLAQIGARAAKAQRYPLPEASLSASATRGIGSGLAEGEGLTSDRGRNEWALNLDFTLPLYAGGGISAEVRQQEARYRAAEQRMLEARRRVQNQARSAWRSVRDQEQAFNSRSRASEAEQLSLQNSRAQLDRNERTAADHARADSARYSALSLYLQSGYDYLLAWLRLPLAAGALNERHLRQIDSRLQHRQPPLSAQAQKQPGEFAELCPVNGDERGDESARL